MESEICYIFAAGEQTPCDIQLSSKDLVIAADGGFDYLEKLGLRADIVLGDFDSVTRTDLPADSIRYAKEKDDTDLFLAARTGLEKGYREFAIYGGFGGRLDHALGNIQVLTFLSRQGATATMYGDRFNLRVITDGTLSFGKDLPENRPGNLCSVLSLSDISVGVTIQGFKYELSDMTLTNAYPLGISNEFTGKKAFINVKKGTIAVLWYLP